MGAGFWIRRFFVVCAAAFVVIACAQLVQGASVSYSVGHASLWAVASAGVFTATRIYHSRRGRRCALCNDIPQGDSAPRGDA